MYHSAALNVRNHVLPALDTTVSTSTPDTGITSPASSDVEVPLNTSAQALPGVNQEEANESHEEIDTETRPTKEPEPTLVRCPRPVKEVV